MASLSETTKLKTRKYLGYPLDSQLATESAAERLLEDRLNLNYPESFIDEVDEIIADIETQWELLKSSGESAAITKADVIEFDTQLALKTSRSLMRQLQEELASIFKVDLRYYSGQTRGRTWKYV